MDSADEAIIATQARRDRRWRQIVAALIAAFVVFATFVAFGFATVLDRFDTADKVQNRQDEALFLLICEFRLQSIFNESVPAVLGGDLGAQEIQRRVGQAQRDVIEEAGKPGFDPGKAPCPEVPTSARSTAPIPTPPAPITIPPGLTG